MPPSTKPIDELQTKKRWNVFREFYDTEKAYVDVSESGGKTNKNLFPGVIDPVGTAKTKLQVLHFDVSGNHTLLHFPHFHFPIRMTQKRIWDWV